MRSFYVLLLCLFLMQSGSPAPEPCVIHVESFEYPPLARQARIQGEVKVSAWIDGQGNVTLPEASTGHALLRDVVLNNFRTWRFQPPPSGSFRLDVTYTFSLDEDAAISYGSTKVVFDLPNQVRVVSRPVPLSSNTTEFH